MSTHRFTSIVASLLIVVLIAPSAFLIAPQRAHALLGAGDIVFDPTNATFNLKTSVESTITTIKSTLTSISSATSAWAANAQWIDANILQPLAFILAGNLIKMLTASAIAFVIGKANGTGVPQFVVDVRKSIQTVSDGPALAYLNQMGQTNSPFASSISSALNTDYLTKTSLAGFWAANMCTLAASSPNVPGYLAGNWSQGGVAAWFALTTQVQNNPYTLYQSSQAQLANVVGPGVGGASGARLAELNWGQGFMSWCGATDGTSPSASSGSSAASVGVNPGDPCTQSDGTPGIIKTPGSTIKSTLDKVLGAQQDQIVRMGNVGPEINSILGNVATVMKTVNFAVSLLGGSNSGGLLGLGDTSSSGSNSTSRLAQFQNAQGTLGITNAQVYQNTSAAPLSGSDMATRVSQYQSAWNTIAAAATTASTSVASLASFCTAAASAASNDSSLSTFVDASTAQAAAAQTALTTEIAPVLAQAANATAIANAATAFVQKVQGELNSGTDTAGTAYTADLQTLQSMSPTSLDLANAEQDAQAFGTASASPSGSLTVSGGSLVDQMNLISTNAQALKASVCTPPTDYGYGGG